MQLTFQSQIRYITHHYDDTYGVCAYLVVDIRVVFGRPFVKRFDRPMVSDRCPVCPFCLSVCDVRALWPNGLTDQDETLHAGVLGPGHIVL